MKNLLTTKDLMALNELMTFENWIATKLKQYELLSTDKSLKTTLKTMANAHAQNHNKLLTTLKENAEGGNE